MKIDLISKEKEFIEFQITSQDTSISSLIHHELLSDPKVTFSGYTDSHPLTKTFNFSVRTKSSDPGKSLQASIKRAVKNIETLEAEAKKSIKKSKF